MEKILLDTDIGSDIDDCLCLGYLLRNPDCKLLGITTVGGESLSRARVAAQLCHLAGRDEIPIFPGSERPLRGEQRQSICQQADYLCEEDCGRTFPQGQAVTFMREQICQNPDEVTLLAIGPLTNVALLFTLYPETRSLLRRLVVMGGRFIHDDVPALHTPLREWNILCDPVAAALVYETGPAAHRSIGLDVTQDLTQPAQWVFSNLTSPEMRPVLEYYRRWLMERGEITFHDPAAAVSIFCPDLIQYRKGAVAVLLEPRELEGLTYLIERPSAHLFAARIDSNGFFEEFQRRMAVRITP